MHTPTARFAASTLRHLTAALAMVAAAGCGDDDGGTGPGDGIAGTYNIVRVNDDATAPYTVLAGTLEGVAYRFDIVSGSLTLHGDGSYTSTSTTRITIGGQQQPDDGSAPQTGRYTVSGSTVTFDPSGNDPEEPNYTATHSGDSLTLSTTEESPNGGAPITITVVARR